MAFSHLEQLISEFLEWKGFLIRRNVRVGPLRHGGYESELDIVGFHPIDNRIVHYEPSVDADSWSVRERRYKKKFEAGRRYIKTGVLSGIAAELEIEQFAVFISRPKDRLEIAGGRVLTVDELMKTIKIAISKQGLMNRGAIPESFSLLRTIQLAFNGYYKVL
jgi:hypothetical protein